MLKNVLDAGVPVLIIFAMVIVGLDLASGALRRVVLQTRRIVAATVGQIVLLPLIAWLLVQCLDLRPAIAGGLLLLAACPGGAMANIYTYLGRANLGCR